MSCGDHSCRRRIKIVLGTSEGALPPRRPRWRANSLRAPEPLRPVASAAARKALAELQGEWMRLPGVRMAVSGVAVTYKGRGPSVEQILEKAGKLYLGELALEQILPLAHSQCSLDTGKLLWRKKGHEAEVWWKATPL
mmetsp:Transcript_66607/g.149560  ORF Transcript_66607/g.149560 Transcript_66607/m.149560 type:complete len:138 (+) Transcript_66607:805-1218(+)